MHRLPSGDPAGRPRVGRVAVGGHGDGGSSVAHGLTTDAVTQRLCLTAVCRSLSHGLAEAASEAAGEWERERAPTAYPECMTQLRYDISFWNADSYTAFKAGNAAKLAGGASVRIHSGCGTNTPAALFWCNTESAVWNNGGDTASLLDPNGSVAGSRSY